MMVHNWHILYSDGDGRYDTKNMMIMVSGDVFGGGGCRGGVPLPLSPPPQKLSKEASK